MWIFLDIDGVLVPEKNFEEFVSQGNPLQFAPVCLNEFENVLRRYPQVLVVISSSWREVFPFEAIHPLFSPDIANQVVGFTPFLDCKIIHQLKRLSRTNSTVLKTAVTEVRSGCPCGRDVT